MLNSKVTSLFLIAVVATLANLLYYSLEAPPPGQRQIDQKTQDKLPAETIFELPKTRLPNLDALSEITKRPLFSPDRRPHEEKVKVSESPEKNIINTDLELTGIVLSEKERVAFLRKLRDKKTTKIGINEDIDGWKLVSLSNNSATLTSGKQQLVLMLNRKGKSSQTSTSNSEAGKPAIVPGQIKMQPAQKSPKKASTIQENIKPSFPPILDRKSDP